MTRLRDLIRREPKRGLALPPWLDRLVSTGIVSRDRQVVRRQRCVNVAAYAGIASGLSYIVITSLYDLRGLWLLNIYNVVLIVAGLVLPFWHRLGENFVAIALILIIGFGQLYTIWMLGITSDLHIYLPACRRNSVLLRCPELEMVSRVFHLRPRAAAVRAQFRAGRRDAAADRWAAARSDFQPHPGDGMHHQRGADLLCAHAGATRRAGTGAAARALRGADRNRDARYDRGAAEVERNADRRPHRSLERGIRGSRRLHVGGPRTSARRGRRISRQPGACIRRARRAARRREDQDGGRLLHGGGGFRWPRARRRGRDRPFRTRHDGGERRARASRRPQARTARRDSLRARDRRRDRRDALFLRRMGRRGEYRLAHGIAWGARPHSGERSVPRSHRRCVHLRRARRRRHEGHR